MESLALGDFDRRRHVPYLYGLIAASRDQEPSVGAERKAADEAQMTAEVVDDLASVAVPDFHGAVLTPRGDPPAIEAERHSVDVSFVSLQGSKRLAVLHIP